LLAETRPLAFEPVLAALQEKAIQPLNDERTRALVGQTRFVVVYEDEILGEAAPLTSKLDRKNIEIIQRLNAFRFGFTQQMASVSLEKYVGGSAKLRSKLKALCRRKLAAYGNGWYRIRPLPKNDTRLLGRSDISIATDHFRAGVSFAPYLLKYVMPGLNIADALQPDHVREAIFHFERAAHFANRVIAIDPENIEALAIRNQARVAEQRCMRFFDVPTLGIVGKLSKKRAMMPRSETYELAKEIVEDQEYHGRVPGPLTLVTLAGATIQWWREVQVKANGPSDAARLLAEIHETYENATKQALGNQRFAPQLCLMVLTRYAAFLRRFGKRDFEIMRLGIFETEILNLLRSKIQANGLYGEWFALYGDSLEDSKAAEEIYKIGVQSDSTFHANYPRWLGSAILAGTDKRILRSALAAMDSEHLVEIADWAEQQKYPKNIDFKKRDYVLRRFNVGRGFLVNNLGVVGRKRSSLLKAAGAD
jgi:hypothetical protein